jgi:DNA-binding XRE family transcriptional regulator
MGSAQAAWVLQTFSQATWLLRGVINIETVNKNITNAGQRLKRMRTLTGCKQSEIARLVGVSQPFIARVESGPVQPSPLMAGRISDAIAAVAMLHVARLKCLVTVEKVLGEGDTARAV